MRIKWGGLKMAQKKFTKCLENKNKALPLHPQSRDEQHLKRAAEVLRNNFLKKASKKFGSFKKMTYLCTRFRL